jgi:hypothetical protein
LQLESLLGMLRRESPETLARETFWRLTKSWKKKRLPARLAETNVALQFVPLGYYFSPLNPDSESCKVLCDYASYILAGRFPRFGYLPVDLGNPPNWHLDFVSGREWPRSDSQSVTVVRWDGSDVKVPWELSRLQFLPVMGKAWRITGDGAIRAGAMGLLENWITENPVGRGVNWTIAMEASLRAISICLFLDLLSPFRAEEQRWIDGVKHSLWEHLHFIEAHNEFSNFARSNHYLSNISGLLCLSSYLYGRRMQERFERYSVLVQDELMHQTYEDGGDYESSTGYHLLVLQMFSMSLRLMQIRNARPREQFLRRLREMYKWTAALADREGRVPQIGDCDDGRVELQIDDVKQMTHVPAGEQDSLRVSEQLEVGKRLLGEYSKNEKEDANWDEPSPPRGARSVARITRSQIFSDSGIGILRKGAAEVFFFAMPNGIKGKGSHTHNDKLSITARVCGKEFLTDCGTFCYTRDPVSRNLFRSVSSHNTLRVDGEEQNEFSSNTAGLFRMGNEARVSRILNLETGTGVGQIATHNGYERLGVKHTRTVSIRENSQIMIEDNLEGRGEHAIETNWHFPQEWSLQIVRSRGRQIECRAQAQVLVSILTESDAILESLITSSFISKTYGSMSNATRVTVKGNVCLPFRLITTFSWRL